MRKRNIKFGLLLLVIMIAGRLTAIAQETAVASAEVVKLGYYNDNNKIQYLLLTGRLKTGKKFQPLKNRVYQLYLDSNRAENLITKVKTDTNGKAKAVLPPQLKQAWENASMHKFIVVAEGTSKEEETITEFEFRKAKIILDTATEDGVRNISVEVSKLEKGEWVPAAGVEMKVGVKRLGGILSGGDDETYTTDSSGKAMVEFKKDSLPGDEQGNIILTARVEDDEQLGNLLIEKKVTWGKAMQEEKNFFNRRTLWSTSSRSPIWLIFMALAIIIAVWGTIFYLVLQIVKIKKLSVNN